MLRSVFARDRLVRIVFLATLAGAVAAVAGINASVIAASGRVPASPPLPKHTLVAYTYSSVEGGVRRFSFVRVDRRGVFMFSKFRWRRHVRVFCLNRSTLATIRRFVRDIDMSGPTPFGHPTEDTISQRLRTRWRGRTSENVNSQHESEPPAPQVSGLLSELHRLRREWRHKSTVRRVGEHNPPLKCEKKPKKKRARSTDIGGQ